LNFPENENNLCQLRYKLNQEQGKKNYPVTPKPLTGSKI
jgi:hypothetical protein